MNVNIEDINSDLIPNTGDIENNMIASTRDLIKYSATFFLVIGTVLLMAAAQIYQQSENAENEKRAKILMQKNAPQTALNNKPGVSLSSNPNTNTNTNTMANEPTMVDILLPEGTIEISDNPEDMLPGISLLNISKN